MINVSIIGLGYVGSAMAIVIADTKNKFKKNIFKVTGLDLNTKTGLERINKINNYQFPFKSSDKLITQKLKKLKKIKNLNAKEFNDESIKNSSIVILSINFDFTDNKKKMVKIFSQYINSFRRIIKNIKPQTLIIIESTLPPGFIENKLFPIFKTELKKRKINPNNIYLSYSYERVTPGKNYINSIINGGRVFSGINFLSKQKCKNFFKKILNIKKFPLIELENITAVEIAKNLENSYRATNIAFIDEWSILAEKLNINLNKIIDAIKLRPTHSNMMYPGIGVGGYCLTKDPLLPKISSKYIYKDASLKFRFSENAVRTNNLMPIRSAKLIRSNYKKQIKGKKILLCGLAYKDEVDDTRNTPSFPLYNELKKLKAKIVVHDPYVKYWEEAKISVLKKIPNFTSFNIIIFATKHQVYKSIIFRKEFKRQTFFDLNNVLSYQQLNKAKSSKLRLFLIGKGYL